MNETLVRFFGISNGIRSKSTTNQKMRSRHPGQELLSFSAVFKLGSPISNAKCPSGEFAHSNNVQEACLEEARAGGN